MSEPIDWKTTSDKDKVELLIRHVVKSDCVYFDETLEVWVVRMKKRDRSLLDTVFCPLSNMNDAWLVVRHVVKFPATAMEAEQQAMARFALWWDQANLWACSQTEACNEICINALRAVGLEVVA